MRRLAALCVVVVVALVSVSARAGSKFKVGGYVSPAFSLTIRPNALPVDRWEVGLASSQAGLIFQARPVDHWRFKIDLVIGQDLVRSLATAELVDVDNDGDIDNLATTTAEALSNIVEETSITWAPLDALHLRLGQMRIPFTSQAQSHYMTLLFPSRSGANEAFLRGTDLGGLLEFDAGDGVLLGSVGLYNGTGLIGSGEGNVKGVLVSGRVDLQPLGPFAFAESDPERDRSFKLGIGAGLVYNPHTSYDSSGNADVYVQDLRASVSLRMAAGGMFFAAEGLFRRQVDTMTSRPVTATGAYGQFGWFTRVGLEPLARVGWAVVDQSFDPRHTLWLEGGVNLYPAYRDERPDSVRVTILYAGEDRITEQEWAHGLMIRMQVRF
jgi:hypothetical protein